jgi:myo-inositol-1(or 4)-monophosphatase
MDRPRVKEVVLKEIADRIIRFVGEESYGKGSSKEYLIDDSPTWCK